MAICNGGLPKIDFKCCEPAPPPLNYRYFFESVTTGYIDDCARNWLALNLTSKQLKKVLDMLREYPATSQDEAIETVLLIFINRSDYETI